MFFFFIVAFITPHFAASGSGGNLDPTPDWKAKGENNGAGECVGAAYTVPADGGAAVGAASVKSLLEEWGDDDENDEEHYMSMAAQVTGAAVPLGIHATGVKSAVKMATTGIALEGLDSASGAQLLGKGFYMYSLGWKTAGAGAAAKLLNGGLNQYAKQGAMTEQKTKALPKTYPLAYVILGMPVADAKTMSGVELTSCAAQVEAGHKLGNVRRVIFKDGGKKDYVLSNVYGPTGKQELVAYAGMVAKLKVTAIFTRPSVGDTLTLLCSGTACSSVSLPSDVRVATPFDFSTHYIFVLGLFLCAALVIALWFQVENKSADMYEQLIALEVEE